jgi:parallel beta-helix repeat protein
LAASGDLASTSGAQATASGARSPLAVHRAGIVAVTGATDNTIIGNVADNNQIVGILMDNGATDNTIIGNVATGNSTDDLFDFNGSCDSNVWKGNDFGSANQSCIH